MQVYMEISGRHELIGHIDVESPARASFQYDPAYMASPGARPASVSLPFQEESFSPARTKAFFDGLLPEGFTRASVARRLHLDEHDYLSILSALGNECLGALRVTGEDRAEAASGYRKLTKGQLRAIAAEGTAKTAELVAGSHLSLAGASGKTGLYYDEKNRVWYQPEGDAPSTHIVKQSHVRLDSIVLNEKLCAQTARHLGILVPESFIVNSGKGGDDEVLFATKRYDRVIGDLSPVIDGLPRPMRLHQEDFAQALGIDAKDKYESEGDDHLHRAFSLLAAVSSDPITDQLRLWDVVLFDYLAGNTDNHLKNISLLYSADLKSIRMAPAYDMVSTAIYRSSTRNMAFHIGGALSLDAIDRDALKRAAFDAGLGQEIAMRKYDAMREQFRGALMQAAAELSEEGFSQADILAERILQSGGIADAA